MQPAEALLWVCAADLFGLFSAASEVAEGLGLWGAGSNTLRPVEPHVASFPGPTKGHE